MTQNEWLQYLENSSQFKIDMDLTRMYQAITYLGIQRSQLASKQIITVAGTNGKGSTVHLLSSMLKDAGFKVGSYYSPHLHVFNERMQVNAVNIDSTQLTEHFSRCAPCLDKFALTYFEFVTLTAFSWFASQSLDFLVLEVGMGGRLDAVNAIDPDLAIITNIAFDHMQWLGNTREAIGFEKAGIMRQSIPCIYADKDCPQTIKDKAHQLDAPLYCFGDNYTCSYDDALGGQLLLDSMTFDFDTPGGFDVEQVASTLLAYRLLIGAFPKLTANYFQRLGLPGRCQLLVRRQKQVMVDVAHNPAAILRLKERIQKLNNTGRVAAVFNMLQDKAIDESISLMSSLVTTWHLAPISNPRGTPIDRLAQHFQDKALDYKCYSTGKAALDAALVSSGDDLVLVFGSFYLLADIGEIA